jgi:hypothetical protein
MYERKESVLEFAGGVSTGRSMMDFDSVTRDWKWCGRYALDSIIEAGERLARTDTHRATLDDMRRRRITLGDYA